MTINPQAPRKIAAASYLIFSITKLLFLSLVLHVSCILTEKKYMQKKKKYMLG